MLLMLANAAMSSCSKDAPSAPGHPDPTTPTPVPTPTPGPAGKTVVLGIAAAVATFSSSANGAYNLATLAGSSVETGKGFKTTLNGNEKITLKNMEWLTAHKDTDGTTFFTSEYSLNKDVKAVVAADTASKAPQVLIEGLNPALNNGTTRVIFAVAKNAALGSGEISVATDMPATKALEILKDGQQRNVTLNKITL
ncbi:MAG: hypothetical protein JWM96_472 [Alphaproteobacteria bacterium]|nr:hypothetical protein [Alphaproteobacteria bacterium]